MGEGIDGQCRSGEDRLAVQAKVFGLVADLVCNHVQIVQIVCGKCCLVAVFDADKQRTTAASADDIDLIAHLRADGVTEVKAVFHVIEPAFQQSRIVHIGLCRVSLFFNDVPHLGTGKPEGTSLLVVAGEIIDAVDVGKLLQDVLVAFEIQGSVVCQRDAVPQTAHKKCAVVVVQIKKHGLRIEIIAKALHLLLEQRNICDAGKDREPENAGRAIGQAGREIPKIVEFCQPPQQGKQFLQGVRLHLQRHLIAFARKGEPEHPVVRQGGRSLRGRRLFLRLGRDLFQKALPVKAVHGYDVPQLAVDILETGDAVGLHADGVRAAEVEHLPDGKRLLRERVFQLFRAGDVLESSAAAIEHAAAVTVGIFQRGGDQERGSAGGVDVCRGCREQTVQFVRESFALQRRNEHDILALFSGHAGPCDGQEDGIPDRTLREIAAGITLEI